MKNAEANNEIDRSLIDQVGVSQSTPHKRIMAIAPSKIDPTP
jgi:hypothetical protein